MSSRRMFLQRAVTAVAGLGGASRVLGMNRPGNVGSHLAPTKASDRMTDGVPIPVVTPDVKDPPFTIDNGARAFQLIAEPVKRKIVPWKTNDCWGFNGLCPGPTRPASAPPTERTVQAFENQAFLSKYRHDTTPGLAT